jgi:uncharacterized protein YeaO (DUF488 family)
MIKIKRIYEEYSGDDGYRILVDRLWPRGVSKEKAHIDLWLKDVAPSTELRKWFGHDPAKWADFKKKYIVELKVNPAFITLKNVLKKEKNITLLYGARDTEHNEARVIQSYLHD